MGKTFMALSSSKLAEMIENARNRVAVVSPSIHKDVGLALRDATFRLGAANVDLVVDLDEKVFRLGYGAIDAIKLLKGNDIKIGITSVCELVWP